MKRLLVAFLVCLSPFSSFAGGGGTIVDVDTGVIAGAQANPTYNFGKPAPVIPTGQLPISSPPELFNPMTPAYALSSVIQQAVAQFGPSVVRGSSVEPQYQNERNDFLELTFAPSSMLTRVGPPSSNHDEWGMEFYPIPIEGNTSILHGEKMLFLGVVHAQTKPGMTVVHPAEQRFIRNELVQYLGYIDGVIAVPVPRGYAVTVGVRNDSSSQGISLVWTRLVTAFFAGSPSLMHQEGDAFSIGSWGMPFILLARSDRGIPFNAMVMNAPSAPAPIASRDSTPVIDPEKEALLRRQQALEEARRRIEERRTNR